MSTLRIVAIAAAMVVLLGIVGRMDYEVTQGEHDHYCEMVKAGNWPDFKGVYGSECHDAK